MSDLIARLETVAPIAAPGDWADVVARAEGLHRRTVRKRLLFAIAVALLAVPTIAIATGHWNLFSLTASEEEVPLPEGETKLGYVVDAELRLPGRPITKLARRVGAVLPLQVPQVVPSPDGRSVVYHTSISTFDQRRGFFKRYTNFLRVYDFSTRSDRLLERGAAGVAWRRDGALAYMRATVPEYRSTLGGWKTGRFGHIVVRPSLDAPATRWTTTEAAWVPLAWAGRVLLAQSFIRGVTLPGGVKTFPRGIWAFSGPGRGRSLLIDTHVAVSPDGRYVLGEGGEGTPYSLRVIEAATGRIVSSVNVDEVPGVDRDEVDRNLLSGRLWEGSWEGDTILAPGGMGQALGGPIDFNDPRTLEREGIAGLAVLRFSGDKLSVERTLKLSGAVTEATGLRYRNDLFEFVRPIFVDRSARQFTSDLRIIPKSGRSVFFFVTCDIVAERCRRGRLRRPFEKSVALVYNPSRPAPD